MLRENTKPYLAIACRTKQENMLAYNQCIVGLESIDRQGQFMCIFRRTILAIKFRWRACILYEAIAQSISSGGCCQHFLNSQVDYLWWQLLTDRAFLLMLYTNYSIKHYFNLFNVQHKEKLLNRTDKAKNLYYLGNIIQMQSF